MACAYGLLSMDCGLLWAKVASYFGQLGFPVGFQEGFAHLKKGMKGSSIVSDVILGHI